MTSRSVNFGAHRRPQVEVFHQIALDSLIEFVVETSVSVLEVTVSALVDVFVRRQVHHRLVELLLRW